MAVKIQSWELGDGVELIMIARVEREFFGEYVDRWAEIEVVPAGREMPAASTGVEERHGETTFVFDETIDAGARIEVIEGFRFARAYLEQLPPGIELGEVRVTVLDAERPGRAWMAAMSSGSSIVIYAGGESEWLNAPAKERLAVMIHELTHVYQVRMTSGADTVVPRWFIEGIGRCGGDIRDHRAGSGRAGGLRRARWLSPDRHASGKRVG